jgi:deazaflavin-dependent oxidoreductase (nitroreductase family)
VEAAAQGRVGHRLDSACVIPEEVLGPVRGVFDARTVGRHSGVFRAGMPRPAGISNAGGVVATFRDGARRWTNRVVNPAFVALVRRGLAPRTYALIETTGRRSGEPRVAPVANGLDGDTFWLLAGLGDRASFVRNIAVDPRVRVFARPTRLRDGRHARWRTGTAIALRADDAWSRHQMLGRGRPLYRLDGIFLRFLAAGRPPLTVRIDLD